MLSFAEFAAPAGVRVAEVTCRDAAVRWSEVEVQDNFRIVLVRRGRFRRDRKRGWSLRSSTSR